MQCMLRSLPPRTGERQLKPIQVNRRATLRALPFRDGVRREPQNGVVPGDNRGEIAC
jgi:hypothetical protein